MTNTMTESCYAGEPSEGGAPEGGCSGLGGRSSRTKTGFTVMVRHFVAAGTLSSVGMVDLPSRWRMKTESMSQTESSQSTRTSTAQVVERSTSPTARWITSASVTNGHARVGEGLILGSFRSAGAPVPCVRGQIRAGRGHT